MTARSLLITLVSTALSLWSSSVFGAGFFTPSYGARTQGRGGAGVLSAVDMNALWYNPAMLAGLGDFHMTLDLTLLSQTASFHRAPRTLENGETITYPRVENLAQPLLVPKIGVASNLGTERFVFALGAWAPNGSPSRYPEDGPQRYTIIDTEGSFVLSQGLAVAWRATDWLWIGGGLQNHIVRIRLVNMLTTWPGFTGEAESKDYDSLFEGVVYSPWTPSANFGARAELLDSMELGASVQLPIKAYDDQARVKQRLPPGVLFDEAVVHGDHVSANFLLPWILRAGARYHQPRWDLELDIVMELWNIFEEINIKPNQIEVQNIPTLGTIETDSLNLPRQYQNTVGLRLGGDFHALPDVLDFRTGVLWEQSAVPPQTLSVLQIDTAKVALSFGFSWHTTSHLSLDVAYTHLIYEDMTITDSIVRQVNPTNAMNTVVVGNGNYQSTVQLIGLGLRYDLK